jgi:amidase
MKFEEYRQHDAVSLAQLIKNKEVTALELLEIAIKRAEEVNPKINAIVTPLYDIAKEQLKKMDPNAPLAGVPFLIKDLGPQLKGTKYTGGSGLLKNYFSTENSVVTERMLKAGLVIFGKTNTPEYGCTPWTEPLLFGPTRNPWNLEHTPGGSSGGSGAAVAAGIVPIASANDGGGSIRIPASCNGLFGVKPTRGRVTFGPQLGESWAGLTSEGVISRSVRDSAVYLDLVCGSSVGDPYSLQSPEKPYAEEVKSTPGKLKIAYSYQLPQGLKASIDPENISAINNTVKLLKELGHEVVEIDFPYHSDWLVKEFYTIMCGETSAEVEDLSVVRGAKARIKDLEPNTWLLYQIGKKISANEYAYARVKVNELNRKMASLHSKYDLFLTPTLGTKPFKIGAMNNSKADDIALRIINNLGLSILAKYSGKIEETAHRTFGWIPYPPLANLTGQPAMTVPLHWSKDNLPIGVMFTAPWNDEATLFQLAAQLEQANPWFKKMPEIN